MHRFVPAIASLVFAPVIFAQLDSNSVTVNVYQNSTLQPDQVVFQVSVSASYNTGLSDVVAALQGSGITMANFTGINTNRLLLFDPVAPTNQPTLEWNFVLVSPLANLKDTVTNLTAFQQKISANNSGLQLSFYVYSTRVSPQLQRTQPCSIAGLLADAQAQAQKLANAAGFTVGAILAMSSSTATSTGNDLIAAASPFFTVTPSCSMTVQFALSR